MDAVETGVVSNGALISHCAHSREKVQNVRNLSKHRKSKERKMVLLQFSLASEWVLLQFKGRKPADLRSPALFQVLAVHLHAESRQRV